MIEPAFERALRSDEPSVLLLEFAYGLFVSGTSVEEVLARFEAVRTRLNAEGRKDDEDAILDVTDAIAVLRRPRVSVSPSSGSEDLSTM